MSEATERYEDIKKYHLDDNSDAWRLVLLFKSDYSKIEQQNKELRKTLKQCMTWLQKESKSMPNYDITQSVLWQSFEEILKQEERDDNQ